MARTSSEKLSALDAAIRLVCPIVGVAVTDWTLHTVRIDFDPSATASQQAAAQSVVAGFDWSDAAQTTRDNLTARASAIARINSADDLAKDLRGVAAAAVDALNTIRQWEMSLKAAIAASSTIANLKTGVAALPSLPDITLAQVKTSITAHINSGDVD